MITFSFSIPLLEIAIGCAIMGAVMLVDGLVYAAIILTGPHWDGESFAPVVRSLLWKE